MAAPPTPATVLSSIRERVPSSAPTVPSVHGHSGFPSVFRLDVGSRDSLPAPARAVAKPTSSSRFAQLLRGDVELPPTASAVSVPVTGAASVVAAEVAPPSVPSLPEGVSSGGTADDAAEWIVDERTRNTNRAMIQSMSSEELSETLDSVEALLGPQLLEKLKAMYASGGRLGSRATTAATGRPDAHHDVVSAVDGSAPLSDPAEHAHDCESHAHELPQAEGDPDEQPFAADDVYEERQPTDVVLRCRSAVPAQRAAAFERLASLLALGSARSGEKFPRVLPVVVRCGIDDTYASVQPAALHAAVVFLVRLLLCAQCLC
jgi:hypothetical protein